MRPNILLITSDQQRTDTLACMGNPHALSPNLDRLAREGVTFGDAYTSAPACAPARISLLTGLHTTVHGAVANGFLPYPDLPAYPELLRQSGYRTILAGKTHFYREPGCFDIEYETGEKTSKRADAFAAHLAELGLERPTDRVTHHNPIPPEQFADAFIADSTMRGVDQVLAEPEPQPFFAHCSLLSPHPAWDPPGQWATSFAERPVPELNYQPGETEDFPHHLQRLLKLPQADQPSWEGPLQVMDGLEPNVAAIDELRRLYYGMAGYVDAQVGRLLDFLDDRGLRDNTLVIFSSDHGSMLWDHGIPDKHCWYDAAWRVPLVLSLPGVLPQNERRDFAVWTDITATILAAAGVPHPLLQGFDLLTPLAAGHPSPRRCGVAHLLGSYALVTSRWKLEYYASDDTGRLFDRQNDPLERHDLYGAKEHVAVRDRLLRALLRWRAEQLDLPHLVTRQTPVGAIAQKAQAMVGELRGIEAEEHLNDAVREIDEGVPELEA